MAEQRINRKLALEITMQEVLGNLEELALDFGYRDGEDCFEILSIEAPEATEATAQTDNHSRVRSPLDKNPIPITLQKQRRVA